MPENGQRRKVLIQRCYGIKNHHWFHADDQASSGETTVDGTGGIIKGRGYTTKIISEKRINKCGR